SIALVSLARDVRDGGCVTREGARKLATAKSSAMPPNGPGTPPVTGRGLVAGRACAAGVARASGPGASDVRVAAAGRNACARRTDRAHAIGPLARACDADAAVVPRAARARAARAHGTRAAPRTSERVADV